MEAVIANISEYSKRTPQEVISAFFEAHALGSVEPLLWEVFRGYAINGPKSSAGLSIRESEIALLFDGLTDLVAAVHALKETDGVD